MKCQKCGQREGTETWAPSGVIGWVHGAYSTWCKRCVVEAQLEHARTAAANIPLLEQLLRDLEG